MSRTPRALAAAALLLLLPGACGGGPAAPTPAAGTPPKIELGYDNPSLPYGIVAIDYHFHDAHPSIPLAPDRAALFTNQGNVKHNVTFAQLGFSRDLPVGGSFTIEDLGKKLGGPGVYVFTCKYHYAAFGMSGTIIIK